MSIFGVTTYRNGSGSFRPITTYQNGDIVYKSKKIMGRTDFSDQFRKIIIRIGYDLNVKRQSACLVINPVTVDNFAALFNCTPVDRASDSTYMIFCRYTGMPSVLRIIPSGVQERKYA